ncbi:MAG TPA: hypothetical protein VHV30_11860 [Polyangiaceae bacterium]|jgi:hypothetical protein|nr:hypothetical protein [Polyangiaceae bacterium]
MDQPSPSLSEVIAEPSRYQGAKVRVHGYCSLTFESKGLYASEATYREPGLRKALWVDLPLDETSKKLHKTTVLIEGTVDATSRGHLGMYPAAITNIERIERWTPPTR